MTDLEIASLGSFFDKSLDMNPCLCRLSRKTIRKFRLSEKYSSSLIISYGFELKQVDVRDISEEEHSFIALDNLVVRPMDISHERVMEW